MTWQKQPDRDAPFFALHDLTHFAVETVLGYRHGFFGLIAEGWEIEDTTGKGARGPLPPEAGETERLVGLFDTERTGFLLTVEQFVEFSGTERRLTEDDLAAVRRRRDELFQLWFAVTPGESLRLEFRPIS